MFHGAIDDPAATERVESLVAAAPEEADQFGLDLALSTLGNVGAADVVGCTDGTSTSFRLGDIADELPTWVGELYFELHRGTLTTQARTKRGNRLLENRLRFGQGERDPADLRRDRFHS